MQSREGKRAVCCATAADELMAIYTLRHLDSPQLANSVIKATLPPPFTLLISYVVRSILIVMTTNFSFVSFEPKINKKRQNRMKNVWCKKLFYKKWKKASAPKKLCGNWWGET